MRLKSSPALALLAMGLMLIVVVVDVLPWLQTRTNLGRAIMVLSFVSAAIWMLTLWWALHHLVFQLAALSPTQPAATKARVTSKPTFAIFYATCDDFDIECFRSCVEQDYPKDRFLVVVCDDSSADSNWRPQVDDVCGNYSGVRVVRRDHRVGFKAGNLNHAFSFIEATQFEWITIVDADQRLPKNYLRQLAQAVAGLEQEVVFVQGARDPHPPGPLSSMDVRPSRTYFQEALEGDVRLFFDRDLRWRTSGGFLPFLGHGGAIRSAAWKSLGGLPEVVSEDYAFAMKLPASGWRGERVESVRSWDGYPRDFSAFVVRLLKYSSGAAELLRHQSREYVTGRAHWVEKLDLGMLLATYALAPLTVFNLFLSAYLGSHIVGLNLGLLTPLLPYLFLGMFLAAFPVLVSATNSVRDAVRHWFWSFTIYSALLPSASWRFMRHLVHRPTFERTPKGGVASPRHAKLSVLTFAFGLVAMAIAWKFRSPFSPILAATGLACALFPLLLFLHERETLRAHLARGLIWVPGILFLTGLVKLWLTAY